MKKPSKILTKDGLRSPSDVVATVDQMAERIRFLEADRDRLVSSIDKQYERHLEMGERLIAIAEFQTTIAKAVGILIQLSDKPDKKQSWIKSEAATKLLASLAEIGAAVIKG